MSNSKSNILNTENKISAKASSLLSTDSYQEFLDTLAKIYHEAILLKKLIYKIKNQMRHFKLRQYIEEVFKFIIRNITQGLHCRKGQQSK